MELEASAGTCPQPRASLLHDVGRSMLAIVVPVIVISLLLAAWAVRRDALYTSASNFGYWLGVVGGSLMAVLLVYPLRKRYRALALLGPLKHWFRLHMIAGIAGPVIVLFHSTFRVGSFNAAIALASMLLVVASGIVGRVIYRKIHNGLYGSRATLAELRLSLDRQISALNAQLARMPRVQREIERFSELVSKQPEGRWQRALHFLSLGWKRRLAGLRVRRAIAAHDAKYVNAAAATQAHLHALAQTIDESLRAAQRTAQFATYEKLFSLWHVVHIPFLCLLVLTAVVHVVAVHAY